MVHILCTLKCFAGVIAFCFNSKDDSEKLQTDGEFGVLTAETVVKLSEPCKRNDAIKPVHAI